MSAPGLDRREALRRLAAAGLGTATLPAWVEALGAFTVEHAHTAQAARRASSAWKPRVLTPQQNATVIALTEAIIPQTETAGAKAAKVNEFIDFVLAEAPRSNRDRFLAGLTWVDARATRDFGKPFARGTTEQQTALLTTISAPAALTGPDEEGAEFFTAIKSMTITGYYTSEVGMREELGDDGVLFFAEFKGCTHSEHQS
jgi:hypothetical protein